MKKNEIIELNGVEYTLELNRDSFIQIDKICNIDKSFEIIYRKLYDYIEDIDDNYNPLEHAITDEELQKEIELKEETLSKLVSRCLFIWLYPNYKLPISKVQEMVKPYLEDEEKAQMIGNKIGQCLKECIDIREEYNQEQKNLKALASKK